MSLFALDRKVRARGSWCYEYPPTKVSFRGLRLFSTVWFEVKLSFDELGLCGVDTVVVCCRLSASYHTSCKRECELRAIVILFIWRTVLHYWVHVSFRNAFCSVEELVRAKSSWKSIESEMKSCKIAEMSRLREFSGLMRRYGHSKNTFGVASNDTGKWFVFW